LAGLYGVHQYLRWRHNEAVEARLRRLAPLIRMHAQANTLPTDLVREVIRAESGGDPQVESARGARGLMQVTSAALEEVRRKKGLGPGDLFDPGYNLRAGAAYLRLLLDEFDGDVYLALAAYNWGPTNVLQACRENPRLSGQEIVERTAPRATIRYCRAILRGRDRRRSVAP
jgi:soluble lytic murein transglycosylase-like protein